MSKLKDLHRSIIRSYKALIANDNSWRVDGYDQGDQARVYKSSKKRKMHLTSTSQKVKAWLNSFTDEKKKGKGKIITVFSEDKGHIPKCLPKNIANGVTGSVTVIRTRQK